MIRVAITKLPCLSGRSSGRQNDSSRHHKAALFKWHGFTELSALSRLRCRHKGLLLQWDLKSRHLTSRDHQTIWRIFFTAFMEDHVPVPSTFLRLISTEKWLRSWSGWDRRKYHNPVDAPDITNTARGQIWRGLICTTSEKAPSWQPARTLGCYRSDWQRAVDFAILFVDWRVGIHTVEK
jgi:hypothetical protein